MFNETIAKQTLMLNGNIYNACNVSDMLRHAPAHHRAIYQDLVAFLIEWFNDKPTIIVHTSGSTGTPSDICVQKQHMINSAVMTCRYLNLQPNDRTLLCMSMQFIASKMMVVRALVAGLDLTIEPPSGHPLKHQTAPFTFVSMVPLQVYNSLQAPDEAEKLRQTDILLIGGGAIDPALLQQLSDFPHRVYSSYGMAETLSHIALCRVNHATSPLWYTPLDGVTLSLSQSGALHIDAPHISDHHIVTKDLAEIRENGDFRLLGRQDNVINSGGVKLHIEHIEAKLRAVIQGHFAITGEPDDKFGEIVVLLTENPADAEQINAVLMAYERPKKMLQVEKIPLTNSQKINRAAVKQLLTTLK